MITSYEYDLASSTLLQTLYQSNDPYTICSGEDGENTITYFEVYKDSPRSILDLVSLEDSTDFFYSTVNSNPDSLFLVKPIGKDISKYSEFFNYYTQYRDPALEEEATSIFVVYDFISLQYNIQYVYQEDNLAFILSDERISSVTTLYENIVKIIYYKDDQLQERVILHNEVN